MKRQSDTFHRVFWTMTALHVGLILGLILFQSVRRWLTRRPAPEIVTFVSLYSPPEDVVEAPVAQPEPPPPQPLLPPPPPPAPVPTPAPAPTPSPRPAIEPSRTRVRAPTAPEPQPAPPRLTEEQIREQLARSVPAAERRPASATADELSRYHALMHQTLYRAWVQPTTVLPGLTVEARIRVQRDGRITQREIIRSSRNATMDESVQRALNAVQSLSPLPSVISGPHHDFTIEFELTGARF